MVWREPERQMLLQPRHRSLHEVFIGVGNAQLDADRRMVGLLRRDIDDDSEWRREMAPMPKPEAIIEVYTL